MSSPTNPYTAAHASPQGEGDARPTALQIINDEGLVNKLTDKVMLVTGTSSGIGVETVRALHSTGAHVFMQVRDMEKGKAVMKEILASSEGKGKLEILYMELGSFASIRAGVEEFLKQSNTLNVLVNNAGISLHFRPNTYISPSTENWKESVTHPKAAQPTAMRSNLVPITSHTFCSSNSCVPPSSHRPRPLSIPASSTVRSLSLEISPPHSTTNRLKISFFRKSH
jgi:hypothetical protein